MGLTFGLDSPPPLLPSGKKFSLIRSGQTHLRLIRSYRGMVGQKPVNLLVVQTMVSSYASFQLSNLKFDNPKSAQPPSNQRVHRPGEESVAPPVYSFPNSVF